jgi:hypothetical protein
MSGLMCVTPCRRRCASHRGACYFLVPGAGRGFHAYGGGENCSPTTKRDRQMTIRLNAAMARQLRAFIETSGVPWNSVTVRHGDDGRVDATFIFNSRRVEVYIVPPCQEPNDRFQGELLIHGRLAGRVDDGRAISGIIDQMTWDRRNRPLYFPS